MKQFCKMVLFSLIICNSVFTGAADDYIFRHIDIPEGLYDSRIRGINMLNDGRIAVITATHLNLYNGISFDYFRFDYGKTKKWNYSRHSKNYYDHAGRIWIKEKDYIVLFDINTNQFIYDFDEVFISYGIDRNVNDFFIDNGNNLWVVDENGSTLYCDIESNRLITIIEGDDPAFESFGELREVCQYKNFYWLVFSNGMISCWDRTSEEFVLHDKTFFGSINELTTKIFLKVTLSGNLWFLHNNGLYYYNRTGKLWKEVSTISGVSNFFTCIDLDHDGNAWVGTSQSEIKIISEKDFHSKTLTGLQLDNGSVIHNDIHSICVDSNNGIWIGTLMQGLSYYHAATRKFRTMQLDGNISPISNDMIRCFLEQEDGIILVGSGKGLHRYDPATNSIERFYPDFSDKLCIELYKDSRHRLWVGTYFHGIYCIENGKVHSFNYPDMNEHTTPNFNVIRSIYEDPTGQLWVSVFGGIGRFNPESGDISLLADRHPVLKAHPTTYDIFPIDDEKFAVTGDNLVFYYNFRNDSIEILDFNGISSDNGMYYIYRDSRSLEWYGSEDGLRIWDSANKELYTIYSENGLPNNSVFAILEDEEGFIWASTGNGLSRVSVENSADGKLLFSFINFNSFDGLQRGRFYEKSVLKASNGTFYFGGHNGFNYFDPRKLVYNTSRNKPIFTDFQLFNTPVSLPQPITQTKEIQLNYKENFITLEFSGLNYVNPSQTYYRYRLKNFDKEWTEVISNGAGRATYTGLKPGRYDFEVFTANNDKLWSEQGAMITFIISPPFWATVYARIFYLLLLIGLLAWSMKWFAKRSKAKLLKEQEKEKLRQKEELEQLKFQFFTNISHEFRTPLSLIIAPLDILLRKITDTGLQKQLKTIQYNAQELLDLVNQLLDFRKLEMNGERLKTANGDIIRLIQSVFTSFQTISEQKKIEFSFESELSVCYMDFDEHKIHIVLNNILFNAFKFTPECGSIHIKINTRKDTKEWLDVAISDTGIGISQEEQLLIFNRFYQAEKDMAYKKGSGIGLHLAKEYIRMHGGSIRVESEIGKGSTFIISLPVINKNVDILANRGELLPKEEEALHSATENSRKSILVIDDNAAFREFIMEQLSEWYIVYDAEDGEEGESKALKHMPDLIISDIMMPKIDGIELCKRLKVNIETSHIPVILLTARTSDEKKISGYDAGADSYISKPFNFDVLLIRVRKLIEQAEKRKELFTKTIEINPGTITITPLDEQLIKKALECVEKNMDNIEFTVDDLSSALCMSRVHLYRKLNSITGQSPSDFIRAIRLKRAAQLLRDTDIYINEITYAIGFNSPKYFTQSFKEMFGMTPTQYRQSQ